MHRALLLDTLPCLHRTTLPQQLTLPTTPGFERFLTTPLPKTFISQNGVCFLKIQKCQRLFRELLNQTRHVGTYLNAFFMVIPNMVMKFKTVEIVHTICQFFDLSSALACRMLSVKYRRKA